MTKEELKDERDRAAEKFAFLQTGINAKGESYTDFDAGKLDGFKAGFDFAIKLIQKRP